MQLCPFVFILRAMVPNAGAIKLSQYLKITMSYFALAILLPTNSQLIGLIELMLLNILIFCGAASTENCDFPGNRMDGY